MNPPVFHFDVSLTLTMMMGPFVVDTKLLYRAVWTMDLTRSSDDKICILLYEYPLFPTFHAKCLMNE